MAVPVAVMIKHLINALVNGLRLEVLKNEPGRIQDVIGALFASRNPFSLSQHATKLAIIPL